MLNLCKLRAVKVAIISVSDLGISIVLNFYRKSDNDLNH